MLGASGALSSTSWGEAATTLTCMAADSGICWCRYSCSAASAGSAMSAGGVVLGEEVALHQLDQDMQHLDVQFLHTVGKAAATRRANVHRGQRLQGLGRLAAQ